VVTPTPTPTPTPGPVIPWGDVDQGTTEEDEELTPVERGLLRQWNSSTNKPKGVDDLREEDAIAARAYMGPLKISFQDALTMMSRYLREEPGAVPPWAMSAISPEEQQAEINKLRRSIGAEDIQAPVPSAPPRQLSEEQQKWWDKALQVAQEKGLPDPAAFARLLLWESGLNPQTPPSSAGAAGIAQFMPGTAKAYGLDPSDPDASIEAAAQYLLDNYNSLQARFGSTNWRQAYAAYFFGATGIGDIIEAQGENWEQSLGEYGPELNFVFAGGGVAAAGVSGAPGGIVYPDVPGEAELTPEQFDEFQVFKIAFDMPLAVYKNAVDRGIDPLAQWFGIQEQALDLALAQNRISREEHDQAVELRLSDAQILAARDLGLDLETYSELALIGVTDAAIAQFQSWGYEPEEYLWARTQGALSHGQIQQAAQDGRDLVEIVAENRMPEEDMKRQAEFNREWSRLWRSFPNEVLRSEGFTEFLNQQEREAREAEQAAMEARRERTEARLRTEIGGTVPGAPTAAAQAPPGTTPVISTGPTRMFWDPKTEQYVSELAPEPEEEIEPYRAPDTDLVMLQAVREGVPTLRAATPQEMAQGIFRGATRVSGPTGALAGPKVMPARQRATALGSRTTALFMARKFLRGEVLPGRRRQAAAEILATRQAAARAHPALAEEEERRRREEEETPIAQP
jgi:hypothetical protein